MDLKKLKDFVFGEKCPECKVGKLNLIDGDGTKECFECGYKKVKMG